MRRSGTRLQLGLGQTGGCDALRAPGNGAVAGSAPEGRAGAGWRGEPAGCGGARRDSRLCTPAGKALCWGEPQGQPLEPQGKKPPLSQNVFPAIQVRLLAVPPPPGSGDLGDATSCSASLGSPVAPSVPVLLSCPCMSQLGESSPPGCQSEGSSPAPSPPYPALRELPELRMPRSSPSPLPAALRLQLPLPL